MNTRVEVPSAVRICSKCGELAHGQRCQACRQTEWDAVLCATEMFRQGAISFEIIPMPNPTRRQQLWARIAQSEFHRLRTARLHSALPSLRTGLDGILYRHSGWPNMLL